MPSRGVDGTSLLRGILNDRAVAVDSLGDDPAATLHASEALAVASASPGRRREFATTRMCARRALERLGRPVEAVARGADRAPVWPDGVVGSLTHCQGYRAAAVATCDSHVALGIDAEPHLPLPQDVHGLVLSAGDDVGEAEEVHGDRIVFSAKEAFYKAWSPVCRTWLEFGDVRITVRNDGRFDARVLTSVPGGYVPRSTVGRWHVVDGLILTSVEWMR